MPPSVAITEGNTGCFLGVRLLLRRTRRRGCAVENACYFSTSSNPTHGVGLTFASLLLLR